MQRQIVTVLQDQRVRLPQRNVSHRCVHCIPSLLLLQTPIVGVERIVVTQHHVLVVANSEVVLLNSPAAVEAVLGVLVDGQGSLCGTVLSGAHVGRTVLVDHPVGLFSHVDLLGELQVRTHGQPLAIAVEEQVVGGRDFRVLVDPDSQDAVLLEEVQTVDLEGVRAMPHSDGVLAAALIPVRVQVRLLIDLRHLQVGFGIELARQHGHIVLHGPIQLFLDRQFARGDGS